MFSFLLTIVDLGLLDHTLDGILDVVGLGLLNNLGSNLPVNRRKGKLLGIGFDLFG